MTDGHNGGADVAVKIAGQELNLRNVKSLNTLATTANLILSCLIAYVIYVHQVEAKDGGKEVAAELKAANVAAVAERRETRREQSDLLKELARAAREQNCLVATGVASMPPGDRRKDAADLCKTLSR